MSSKRRRQRGYASEPWGEALEPAIGQTVGNQWLEDRGLTGFAAKGLLGPAQPLSNARGGDCLDPKQEEEQGAMNKARGNLTYANVMATVAVFIALGGSAYAATQLKKNSVGTKQIKNSAVTEAKIKNESIVAAKVKGGSLTGAQINASTLGNVPSATHANTASEANTLQGIGANQIVHGSGEMLSARREMQIGQSNVLIFNLPGIGNLTATCQSGTTYPEVQFRVNNNSGSTMDMTYESGETVDAGYAENGSYEGFGEESFRPFRIQAATRAQPATIATLNISFVSEKPAPCIVFAQASVGT